MPVVNEVAVQDPLQDGVAEVSEQPCEGRQELQELAPAADPETDLFVLFCKSLRNLSATKQGSSAHASLFFLVP